MRRFYPLQKLFFQVHRRVPRGSVRGPVFSLLAIFVLFCLLASAGLFKMTTWTSSLPLLGTCCGDYTRSSMRLEQWPEHWFLFNPSKSKAFRLVDPHLANPYSTVFSLYSYSQIFLGSPFTALFYTYFFAKGKFFPFLKTLSCYLCSLRDPSQGVLFSFVHKKLHGFFGLSPGWFPLSVTKLERLH